MKNIITKNNKFFIFVLFFISLAFLSSKSYAAMEIKPDTTTKVSITASNSFAYCYNLRASSTTLGNNTVDPHLTLNSDWATVAYLAASVYGTNTSDSTKILSSTTGNESGVKNLGYTYTQTSSILTTANSNSNYANIYSNKNTKYVEILPVSKSDASNVGKAMYETNQWSPIRNLASNYDTYYPVTYVELNAFGKGVDIPISIRTNIFSIMTANGYSTSVSTYKYGGGVSCQYCTFRPVIWN